MLRPWLLPRLLPGVLLYALALGGAAHENPTANAVQANFDLARQYRNGNGVARDSARALALFESGARQHHAASMFALSNMLAAGEGAASNIASARAWLEAAAELEHPEALQQLALHVQDGTLGYQRDAQRADQLMRALKHAMSHRRAAP